MSRESERDLSRIDATEDIASRLARRAEDLKEQHARLVQAVAKNQHVLRALEEYPERVKVDATPEEIRAENAKLLELIDETADQMIFNGAELLGAELHGEQLITEVLRASGIELDPAAIEHLQTQSEPPEIVE